MGNRETVSERRVREEKAAERAKMAASTFGGLAGQAAKLLMGGRKKQLDEELKKAGK